MGLSVPRTYIHLPPWPQRSSTQFFAVFLSNIFISGLSSGQLECGFESLIVVPPAIGALNWFWIHSSEFQRRPSIYLVCPDRFVRRFEQSVYITGQYTLFHPQVAKPTLLGLVFPLVYLVFTAHHPQNIHVS